MPFESVMSSSFFGNVPPQSDAFARSPDGDGNTAAMAVKPAEKTNVANQNLFSCCIIDLSSLPVFTNGYAMSFRLKHESKEFSGIGVPGKPLSALDPVSRDALSVLIEGKE